MATAVQMEMDKAVLDIAQSQESDNNTEEDAISLEKALVDSKDIAELLKMVDTLPEQEAKAIYDQIVETVKQQQKD